MNQLLEQICQIEPDAGVVLFDYDSTIAKVPIDWPQARVAYRDYLGREFPVLDLPGSARVDELEALAIRHYPAAKEQVFRFRFDMESALDGGHEPLPSICECIQHLARQSDHRLFIISNNLHRTVEMGLNQLGLNDAFEAILGVDDVGVPKPDTRAFTLLQESYGLWPEDCIFIGDNDRTDGGFCKALAIPFINITENKT
jgi:HAD superfamily hydrolase (TIGR01549 family)